MLLYPNIFDFKVRAISSEPGAGGARCHGLPSNGIIGCDAGGSNIASACAVCSMMSQRRREHGSVEPVARYGAMLAACYLDNGIILMPCRRRRNALLRDRLHRGRVRAVSRQRLTCVLPYGIAGPSGTRTSGHQCTRKGITDRRRSLPSIQPSSIIIYRSGDGRIIQES